MEKTIVKKCKLACGNSMLLRWSWREIWLGQLWPVVAALTLIIASVVALSALAMRVEKVMTAQGRSLIAADLVFRSANPIPELLLTDAQHLRLTVSQQTSFASMAFSDSSMQLVSVKVVDSSYPLRGNLLLMDQTGKQHRVVQPQQLWLDERLFSLLDVSIGDMLAIGDAELMISGKIQAQPELVFNPFRSMPNVFIHQTDLRKTGSLQLGSRVQYRTFFNGENSALTQLQNTYQLQAGESWLSAKNQSRTAQLIAKAKQYLSLTIVTVILMASLILVLTCQHYARSRVATVAMLKSMGASRGWLRKWLLLQVAIMFVSALLLGSLLGLGGELLLRLPLRGILPPDLPSYGWQPFVFASAIAFLIGLPALGMPLKRLLDTPAISVLQAQAASDTKQKGWWLIVAPLAVFFLFYGNTPLVWILCIGLVLSFLVLASCSYGLLHLLSQGKWGAAMTLALSRIKRSPKNSIMQLAALSGSLMLVAVIWLLRTELLGDWQEALPPDAANVFAVNIAPEQRLQYLQKLDTNKIARSPAYPIIRGRLTAINGQSAQDVAVKNNESPNVLHREINFTWAEKLPIDNEVVAGGWTEKNGVSVEQRLARELAISVGDKLSFSVNSQIFTARVNSLREVQWQSMKPNFYFIFSADVIAQLPATWLVSFRINEAKKSILNEIARNYPTVSLLDFRTIGAKIQSMLTQISWSLTVLAGLGVFSGVLLIFTLLRLSLQQRQDEITLYRTLGASRKRISQTLWSEYGLMALTAGLVAVAGAESVVFALLKWGFKLVPNLHLAMWFVLPLLAMLLIYFSLISVINKLLKPLK